MSEKEPPAAALHAVTLGETMMAFEALEPGPLREVHRFKKWIGGAEDNFAIGLARLGFNCGWISRVGADEFGREIVRTLRGEGIDTSRVIRDPAAPTGVFFVESRSEGDPRCYSYRQGSAASRLRAADLDGEYIAAARILFLTGITPAISPSARQAAGEFFRVGEENGRIRVFDPNLRLKLWDIDEARRVLIPIMQQSDYVLPGERELQLLMACDDLEGAITRAGRLGISRMAVKRGAQGALWVDGSQVLERAAPFRIRRPVSTMGAGDCFAAGFVAGLLNDRPPVECLRWGNALGAFCLMGSGPYQSLPELSEFRAFLEGAALVDR